MRDVFKEYRQGLISWDEAFATANNIAATTSESCALPPEETDYWASQMESLAVDMACSIMKTLGYKQNESGAYFKPGEPME